MKRYQEYRIEMQGCTLSECEMEKQRLEIELKKIGPGLRHSYAEEELRAVKDTISDIERHMRLEEQEAQ